jgi:hypothetical protein
MGSNPVSPISILAVKLSSEWWFAGILIASVLSSNIAYLISKLQISERMMYMINVLPVVIVLVVVGDWCNGSTA